MTTVNRRRTSTGEWRYDVRYRVNGRPVERAFKRRRDAEAFRRRLEADELAGVLVDPRGGRRTFAEVAVEWLASNPGKRPSSWARDEVAVRKHLVPHFGAERIEWITASSIQALVNDWSATTRPGRSSATTGWSGPSSASPCNATTSAPPPVGASTSPSKRVERFA